ncbi:hypothetical protein [Streptomyces sp. NPDC093111]|uniref:hypothetical protein n=1 Tax=Streptomyces sp. NPDC093111 TaxID=3154978 RepID=UPI00343656A7
MDLRHIPSRPGPSAGSPAPFPALGAGRQNPAAALAPVRPERVGAAHGLLRAAGFEANLHHSAVVAEVAARLAWQTVSWAGRAAARYPILASAAVALAVMVCRHQGFLDPARRRAGAVSLKETAAPLLERFAAASEDHALTRGRLVAVEAAGSATTEQFAARRLARTHAALTPTQLREALAADGARIPATRLKPR